jgi:hypothetical protein
MKKIITAKAEVATPAKKQTIKKPTADRWNQTFQFDKQPIHLKDRIERGELIRRIHATVPNFVGAREMSINNLRDVELSISVCQVNRICYGK